MAEQLYICPQCGCPDLVEPQKSPIILPAERRKVYCPNCKWEGKLAESAGILTTEHIYDTKAVLNLLLYTTTKHAAGPIAQALIFVGLLEKDDQEGLNKVMRAAVEGLIRETFVAAAEHAAQKTAPKPFCPTCMGSGVDPDSQIDVLRPCPRCSGAGHTQKPKVCDACGGRHIIGEEIDLGDGDNRCKVCNGTGELL